MFVRESVLVGGKPMTFETGRLAKQAHGSALVSYGESAVLVTATSTDERPGLDFFPLTCEYVEKTYAAGRIPGGFFKREGRLRDTETLTSRLIDRPLRPLFPKGYRKDTQVVATVLSSDKKTPTDVLALTGASAATHISDIPWDGPVAGLRIGRVDGELLVNPTFEQLDRADIDLIVAATRDAIVMVEGGAAEASESDVLDALAFAQEEAKPIIELLDRLRAAVGRPKREFVAPELEAEVADAIAAVVDEPLAEACVIRDKAQRYEAYASIKQSLLEKLAADLGDEKLESLGKLIKGEFEHRKAAIVRRMVTEEGRRIDGRDVKTIRPISCEVGLFPRTHGSALFQRGETQAVVVATLGTAGDEQKIDALIGESWKQFMLHYNFPPFCTGETKPLRGPGPRDEDPRERARPGSGGPRPGGGCRGRGRRRQEPTVLRVRGGLPRAGFAAGRGIGRGAGTRYSRALGGARTRCAARVSGPARRGIRAGYRAARCGHHKMARGTVAAGAYRPARRRGAEAAGTHPPPQSGAGRHTTARRHARGTPAAP